MMGRTAEEPRRYLVGVARVYWNGIGDRGDSTLFDARVNHTLLAMRRRGGKATFCASWARESLA